MLEAIQILIDRMEMFPDDFRQNGNLNDFLYILDDIESRIGTANYYKSILTEEEINAFREAALKFQRENKLLKEMRSFTQKSGLYGEVAVGGAGGGGTGVIGGTKLGGGAFVTKTGALFTPANIPKKKKK
jgi:hypothetical protein